MALLLAVGIGVAITPLAFGAPNHDNLGCVVGPSVDVIAVDATAGSRTIIVDRARYENHCDGMVELALTMREQPEIDGSVVRVSLEGNQFAVLEPEGTVSVTVAVTLAGDYEGVPFRVGWAISARAINPAEAIPR
ncbi:MAG: hypothetical protein AAF567_21955 [Actinomycetota bacterium]